jgi:hypothetical protein
MSLLHKRTYLLETLRLVPGPLVGRHHLPRSSSCYIGRVEPGRTCDAVLSLLRDAGARTGLPDSALADNGPGMPDRTNGINAMRPIQRVVAVAQRITPSWKTTVAAVGAAALLVVALPLSAQADTGVFYYYDVHGTNYSITNPAPGACLRTLEAIHATNHTGQSIDLYSSPDCQGLVHTVKPGEDFPGNFNSAKAVF